VVITSHFAVSCYSDCSTVSGTATATQVLSSGPAEDVRCDLAPFRGVVYKPATGCEAQAEAILPLEDLALPPGESALPPAGPAPPGTPPSCPVTTVGNCSLTAPPMPGRCSQCVGSSDCCMDGSSAAFGYCQTSSACECTSLCITIA
jgi:hypothetical protein